MCGARAQRAQMALKMRTISKGLKTHENVKTTHIAVARLRCAGRVDEVYGWYIHNIICMSFNI